MNLRANREETRAMPELLAEPRKGPPIFDHRGNPVFDTYGHRVGTLRRGRWCRCKVPCQAFFVCVSSHHRGPRETPYCCGCADDEEIVTGVEVCDDCWCKRERNRERVAKRRAA